MSCERFDQERVLYAYGEACSTEFEQHRRACERCRGELDEMRLVSELYRSGRSDEPPLHVALPRRSNLWKRMALAACAAAAFGAALWLEPTKTVAPLTAAPVAAATPAPFADVEVALVRQKLDSLAVREESQIDFELARVQRRIQLLENPNDF